MIKPRKLRTQRKRRSAEMPASRARIPLIGTLWAKSSGTVKAIIGAIVAIAVSLTVAYFPWIRSNLPFSNDPVDVRVDRQQPPFGTTPAAPSAVSAPATPPSSPPGASGGQSSAPSTGTASPSGTSAGAQPPSVGASPTNYYTYRWAYDRELTAADATAVTKCIGSSNAWECVNNFASRTGAAVVGESYLSVKLTGIDRTVVLDRVWARVTSRGPAYSAGTLKYDSHGPYTPMGGTLDLAHEQPDAPEIRQTPISIAKDEAVEVQLDILAAPGSVHWDLCLDLVVGSKRVTLVRHDPLSGQPFATTGLPPGATSILSETGYRTSITRPHGTNTYTLARP